MLWLWLLFSALGLYIICSFILSVSLFKGMLVKPKFGEKNAPLSKEDKTIFFEQLKQAEEWLEKIKKEEVYITSSNIKLHGLFLDRGSDRSVILVHGYGASLKYRVQDAPFYYNNNFNVLLIDLRTHGKSEGKYVSLGKFEALDLLEWINWLNKRTNNSKIILDGVSMGAATVNMASCLNLPKNVVFAVSDCSFTTMRDELRAMYKRFYIVPDWLLIGLGEGYSRWFGKFSLYKSGPIDCVKNANIPIIFIHGTGDKLIPPQMADKLFEACTSDKKLVKIEKAGHAMSFCYNRKACESAILEFIKKYF